MEIGRTLASPSAARCAYILWCKETLSMFFAWGREESAQDKLGKAMSLSAETDLFDWQEFCLVAIVWSCPTEKCVYKGVKIENARRHQEKGWKGLWCTGHWGESKKKKYMARPLNHLYITVICGTYCKSHVSTIRKWLHHFQWGVYFCNYEVRIFDAVVVAMPTSPDIYFRLW
jgi:hypothetical protein